MSVDYSLYLVTDPEMSARLGLARVVEQAVLGGVTLIQVRAKGADVAAVSRQVREIRDVVSTVPVIVNDSVQAAVESGADGVHLGQSDGDPVQARAALGPSGVVGLSVSTTSEIDAARRLPVGTLDYLGVGPVWATGTKANAAQPLLPHGIARLVHAAEPLACVAIGGVTRPRVAQLRGLGLAGICVVSAICAADDPRAAAEELRQEWEAG